MLEQQPALDGLAVDPVGDRDRTELRQLVVGLGDQLEARLARALLQLVPAPEYEAFPIKQSEIAEVAGTSRETATRVLNQFEAEGFIALGRTRVRLLRPEALSQIAEAKAS